MELSDQTLMLTSNLTSEPEIYFFFFLMDSQQFRKII